MPYSAALFAGMIHCGPQVSMFLKQIFTNTSALSEMSVCVFVCMYVSPSEAINSNSFEIKP